MLVGVDIGGTKCALSLGHVLDGQVKILDRVVFATPSSPSVTLEYIIAGIQYFKRKRDIEAIGISCGGPLDSRRGIVLSPPNLPGWDGIDLSTPLHRAFGVPVGLQNDANACALAEWRWGNGQGCQNLVFLTFGTGMGAGLILNGQLYAGTSDLAGEVGHLRLAETGPLGYGKAGSFEGFCSGGGIAHLASLVANEHLQVWKTVSPFATRAAQETVTAEQVGMAAQASDPVALAVWDVVARRLGQGLALLIDLLNPQRIILGSIYLRQRAVLEERMLQVIRAEALPQALAVCEILPAGLGERLGDIASLAVASYTLTADQNSDKN